MVRLSETVSRLAKSRSAANAGAASDRLEDFEDFGSNPGNLRARTYVPAAVGAHPALVVVLHGCTQSAAGYDAGAGWSALADELGFVLLFPEQQRANNPNLCFNWFAPQDTIRDGGEAQSIRQMIGRLIETEAVDPARIFVTGLSAGGAMASVMLATYPELFAGGAILAGLPYGSAAGVGQALERMRGQGGPAPAALGSLVRRASPHQGPWPTISIWHGSSDTTVAPSNAQAVLAQWRDVHGVGEAPSAREQVDGHPRRVWRDAAGRDVIEEYSIAGMGHGTPLDTLGGAGGSAGAYMLEAGISSTRRIAAFWGLTAPADRKPAPKPVPAVEMVSEAASLPVLRTIRAERIPPEAPPKTSATGGYVNTVIENALRAAGLMR